MDENWGYPMDWKAPYPLDPSDNLRVCEQIIVFSGLIHVNTVNHQSQRGMETPWLGAIAKGYGRLGLGDFTSDLFQEFKRI